MELGRDKKRVILKLVYILRLIGSHRKVLMSAVTRSGGHFKDHFCQDTRKKRDKKEKGEVLLEDSEKLP